MAKSKLHTAPASRPVIADADGGQLYSPAQVAVGTFLGGPVA